MRIHSIKFFKSTVYVLSLLILGGCCYPKDPVCSNMTSISSGNFWEPNCFYESEPCDDGNEDDFLSMLQASSVQLADLIDVALRNNPATQRTWADARAAAYDVSVAKSILYPQVTAQSLFQYNDVRLDDTPLAVDIPLTDPNAGVDTGAFEDTNINPLVSLTNTVSVSYLLLDFGGRCASIEAARQALYISDWTHNRQIQTVIFSLLQNYYTYEGLLALIESRQSDLENASTSLRSAEALFNAGVRTKLDVLQARTNLINIELNIVDLERQRDIARGNLATNIGLPANAEFHIPPVPKDFSLDRICASVDKLIAIAKDLRPDLAATYAEHERTKAEVVFARSQGLPTISANMNFQHINYFKNENLNNHNFSGSIALNIPIFDGFLYRSQVRRAQEFVRGACALIRETELNVILDVVTSYANFTRAVESYKFSEENLKYSTEAYQAALVSYNEGISTILDLLNSQRDLAVAKAQKIQAMTEWAISLANVAFSTGSLGILDEDAITCKKRS